MEPQTSKSANWKARYKTRGTLWTAIAASAPDKGLCCSNKSGVYQLYAWDVPTGDLTQLTGSPTGAHYGEISPDGLYVYYLHDEAGSETGHYVRVPFGGGEPDDMTPELPQYSSWSIAPSGDARVLGFVAATHDGFQLYIIEFGADGTFGPPRLLTQSKKLMAGLVLSYDGSIAVVTSGERTAEAMLDRGLIAFSTDSGEQIGELWDSAGSSIEAVACSPVHGDNRVVVTANRSGDRRPVLWNPRTGERTDLDVQSLEGDIVHCDWSADGRRLLLCRLNRAVQQLHIYDLEAGSIATLEHTEGTLGFMGTYGIYFSRKGEIFTQWQDPAHPSRLIALDEHTGKRTRTVLGAADVPPGRPWTAVSFESADGQTVQGWLGVPEGAGPFPTILHTHGGPHAVTLQQFSPDSQAWLDHGYAYLTVNYRGSTTFGKAFEQQIWGDVGHWEIEDMVAARDWLVSQGIAHAGQIFLTGGSYGGYLTLLGLGKRPDLWAGGMARVAIADWTLLYRDEAETLRGIQRSIFGGTPEEKPDEYAASSPLTYAEQVGAPVLVIQGRNDTRCPDYQMEVYAARLCELGKNIEVQWFDAGHGSLDTEQQIAQQEAMLQFARKVLG